MVFLTKEEISLLRQALGLSFYCRENPIRNHLFAEQAAKYPDAVESLLKQGYLVADSSIGQGGKEHFYKATDAGRFAVLEQKWPAA